MQFVGLPLGDLAQLIGGDPQAAQHVVVDHHAPTAGQRSDGELLVARGAELADDERVQRRAQRVGHLVGDRNAAARQAEHHHVGSAPIGLQQTGENLSGLVPVLEDPPRLMAADTGEL